MEEPGLGVEPSLVGLVGDLDPRAEAVQLVEGPLLCDAGVDRGQDPQLQSGPQEFRQRVADHQKPGPTDERAEEVDPLGAIASSLATVRPIP